jgi:hypothetical protein
MYIQYYRVIFGLGNIVTGGHVASEVAHSRIRTRTWYCWSVSHFRIGFVYIYFYTKLITFLLNNNLFFNYFLLISS